MCEETWSADQRCTLERSRPASSTRIKDLEMLSARGHCSLIALVCSNIVQRGLPLGSSRSTLRSHRLRRLARSARTIKERMIPLVLCIGFGRLASVCFTRSHEPYPKQCFTEFLHQISGSFKTPSTAINGISVSTPTLTRTILGAEPETQVL